MGCSPWGCKELDTTEHTHTHDQLVFIPEYKGDLIEKFTVIHHINRLTERNNYPNAEKAFCKV